MKLKDTAKKIVNFAGDHGTEISYFTVFMGGCVYALAAHKFVNSHRVTLRFNKKYMPGLKAGTQVMVWKKDGVDYIFAAEHMLAAASVHNH